MSGVRGKHWPPGTPFLGFAPGDWIFSDERVQRVEENVGDPHYISFGCPRRAGRECTVPISLDGKRGQEGKRWKWDGNREAPTLTPSINCLSHNPRTGEEYAGCGWHGHLTAGVFRGA